MEISSADPLERGAADGAWCARHAADSYEPQPRGWGVDVRKNAVKQVRHELSVSVSMLIVLIIWKPAFHSLAILRISLATKSRHPHWFVWQKWRVLQRLGY